MKIYVATHNAHKLREIGEILPGFEIVADDPDAEETENTFAGNALIKVRAIAAKHRGDWAMADDSGLEVDALGGQYGAQGLAVNVAFQVGGEDAAGHMIAVLQLLGQSVQPVFPAGRQDEPEAQPRVLAGELLPDAGRSTGDPDCFLVHRTCPFSEARSCVDGAQLVGGEGGVIQRLEVV